MVVLQQKTLQLEKNTSLDWSMQSIEDDINTLQNRLQGGSPIVGQDRMFSQLAQQVQALSQNPLWHDMQKTAVEIQQFKEVINPVMKDIESRLNKLETAVGDQSNDDNVQMMKQPFHPVMQDIERRLIALENRLVETANSNVSFADEGPSTIATLIERVQVLESKVNNLEPSLSTLPHLYHLPLWNPPRIIEERRFYLIILLLLPKKFLWKGELNLLSRG